MNSHLDLLSAPHSTEATLSSSQPFLDAAVEKADASAGVISAKVPRAPKKSSRNTATTRSSLATR